MTADRLDPVPRAAGAARTRLIWEVSLVLAVTVGRSAVYSVVDLIRASIRAANAGETLAGQQTQVNPRQDSEAIWDVIYQVLGIGFSLAVVGLVIYLLWEPGTNALRRIGLDFRRIRSDLVRGLVLAAVIGIPGLGLYALGRVLGITVTVVAAPLDSGWWTIPLLILSAVRAGLLEEVIFVAYLFDRLRRIGWSPWTIIVFSALLRGAYHAYQGFGSILGNAVMGIVFGWCYRRWGRVMPLVIAHTLIDIVAFIGYPLAVTWWPGIFGPVA